MGLHWAPEGTVTNRWASQHQVPAHTTLSPTVCAELSSDNGTLLACSCLS